MICHGLVTIAVQAGGFRGESTYDLYEGYNPRRRP